MEAVHVHLAKVEELIEQIEGILENAKAVPFTSKVSVDKNSIYELIDEMRPILEDIGKDLPNEIVQARRVVTDSDKIINEARHKAELLERNAQRQAEQLTDDHEIYKHAQSKASSILDEAKSGAKEYKLGAAEYADGILESLEQQVKTVLDTFIQHSRVAEDFFADTMEELMQNRQELRSPQGGNKNSEQQQQQGGK
jgi:vacuolar-type H+-ATPase subunit H